MINLKHQYVAPKAFYIQTFLNQGVNMFKILETTIQILLLFIVCILYLNTCALKSDFNDWTR